MEPVVSRGSDAGIPLAAKPQLHIAQRMNLSGRRRGVYDFLTIKIDPQIVLVWGRVPAFECGSRPARRVPLYLYRFYRSSLGDGLMPVGARWSNGMSRRVVQAETNLLSAFALTIAGTLGVALPMALLIIWICS
jgi:hypothetical protein